MKKRICLLAFCVFLILTLTGCISEKNRDKVISILEKNDVIKDDWTFLGDRGLDSSPIPDIYAYEYYYQDSNDKYYLIRIYSGVQKKDEHELYYPISVFNYAEAYEGIEYYRDDNDELQTRPATMYRETDNSICDKYRVYRRNVLFWDKFTLKMEENEE